MNRMSRSVLAAALSAVVALGAAPAAVAGPHGHGYGHGHGHGKGAKVTAKAMKQERHGRAGQGRTFALAKQADRKASYLDRLSTSNKVSGLGELALPVVLNMSADSDELRDLADAFRQGSFDLADLGDLRAIRPEVYNRIVSQIRLVSELIADLEATPAADPIVPTEPTEPTESTVPLADAPAATTATATATATVVDAAGQLAALQALLVELQGYDARTSRIELKSAQTVIEAAQEALDDEDGEDGEDGVDGDEGEDDDHGDHDEDDDHDGAHHDHEDDDDADQDEDDEQAAS